MLKYICCWLFFIIHVACINAQNVDTDYQLVLNLDNKMQRKMLANELMIDPQEKFIIVNYGNRPTHIIVYSMQNYEAVANFRLSDWVDFSAAFMDYETNQLYIKESRYSSEYFRMNINSNEFDRIQCHIIPGGCTNAEPTKSVKAVYTADKQYYITINKNNTREVRVYKRKSK